MKNVFKITLAAAFLAASPVYAQDALNNYQPGPRLIDGSQLNLMVAAVNNLQGQGTPGAITGTTGTFSGVVSIGNGTVALPGLTFGSDLDTGLYRIGANNAGFAAAGAKVLDIATTGLGVTGVLTSGAHAVTSASANALVAGLAGATNPAFNVDASTASSATGLNVKSAAAASGLALSVTSSGTDENLTINAKGAGTVTINGTATGNIVMGAAVTGVSSSNTGGFTAKSGTAVPATAGAIAAGAPITMFSTGIKIWVTSDAPTHSATKGDLCINTGGSSSSTRLYINNGTTTWIAVTTAS